MPKKKTEHYEVYTRQIEALAKVASLINSGMYLEELLRLIVHVTAEIMNSKISSLMLLDPNKNEFLSPLDNRIRDNISHRFDRLGGIVIAGDRIID